MARKDDRPEPPFVADLVGELDAISLDELEESAALRERVDTKYVIPREELGSAIARLNGSHRVLEIDGRRSFDYESVYFDTPGLLCFEDHVSERRPRFKTRTRFYRETRACFLEVKVKDAEDRTTKKVLERDPADHGRLTDGGLEFIHESLTELTDEAPPIDLGPTLGTRYRRITLAARDGAGRVSLDFDVRLRAMDNRRVALQDDLALVETKSEQGGGPFDEALVAAGCEPTSVSKYRLGVGLLLADDPEQAGGEPVRRCFG